MLIGIVDPSHDERATDEPGRYPNWLTLDEVLHVASRSDPKWSPWQYELLAAGLAEHQERDYISTSLLAGGCPRTSVLERREDYIGTIDSMWAAFQGTMIHRTLEAAVRPGGVAEWRFFTEVEGYDISCSPDLVTVDPGTLWDWKRTENPPTFGYPFRKHTLQVQYNRYIVNHAKSWVDNNGEKTDVPFNPRELNFEHCVVVYLGPKGPKPIEVMETRDVQTPNGKTVRRKVPFVWSDQQVVDDMMPRLEAMAIALDAYPEWPDGLEKAPGWEGPPGWKCPGPPLCYLPNDLAKRYPGGLVWDKPKPKPKKAAAKKTKGGKKK